MIGTFDVGCSKLGVRVFWAELRAQNIERPTSNAQCPTVTFRYKKDLDAAGIPQFGLVAEEVEKVNPDLVARDDQGKPYTMHYDAVNAMLLNEFLKEHRKVESLEKQLKAAEAKQEEKISALTELVKAQGAQLQKLRAELATGRVRVAAATGLEARKSSPQIILNNQ